MFRHTNLHFLLKRELNALYISIALRTFSSSMIGIFIPIFLLNLNYSLFTVLVFYGVMHLTHSLCVIPAAKLGTKLGFKHLIIISAPLILTFYLLLYSLETHNWPIYAMGILLGVKNSLFWTGYHMDFARFSHRKKRGSEIAKIKIISTLVSVIGPFLGGLILTFFGFNPLFLIVSGFVLFSTIPLFLTKDNYGIIDFNIKDVFKKAKKRDIFGFMGSAIEGSVAVIIWPVFIFFSIVHNYSTLGLISTISLGFSVIFIYLIGKFSDIHRRLVMKIGSILNSIVWLIRTAINSVLQVFFIDSLYGMTKTIMSLPFEALSYDKARKKIKFIVFREMTINLTIAIFLFIFALIVTNLKIGFYISSIASLLHMFF